MIEKILYIVFEIVVTIYIGINVFVFLYNYKHPTNKLLYPTEVPEPDETEFDKIWGWMNMNIDNELIKLYINTCKEMDPNVVKERFALANMQIQTGRFDNNKEIERILNLWYVHDFVALTISMDDAGSAGIIRIVEYDRRR